MPIDYAPIEEFLVGRVGMTQAQAARVGMTEYQQRVRGWENAQKEEWERLRWLAWHSYNLSPFLKNKPKTAKDIQAFPWEKGAKKPKKITRKQARITAEEKAALDAIMKDFYERKYSS